MTVTYRDVNIEVTFCPPRLWVIFVLSYNVRSKKLQLLPNRLTIYADSNFEIDSRTMVWQVILFELVCARCQIRMMILNYLCQYFLTTQNIVDKHNLLIIYEK